MILKKIALTTLFVTIITVMLSAAESSKSAPIPHSDAPILKKMMFIKVSSIDSIDYSTVYTYPDEEVNALITAKLDSVTNSWFVKNHFGYAPSPGDTLYQLETDIELTSEQLSKTLNDTTYIERLQDMDSRVELSFNPTVKNYIALYTIRNRKQLALMLGLAEYYFPMIEEVLDKYDMPLEIKYLTIIESALNPRAYSKAGATGMWQFMYKTGKSLDLEITSYVDERRDPVKATDAAARYLMQLHDIYQDWHLALAAYNCGPGNVNKAIRRSGGKRNYWDIYYRLPRETRGYLPALIGAAYSMNYASEHGIKPILPQHPINNDTIKVNRYINLNQVAQGLQMPIEQLRDLNPQYKVDVIPAKADREYVLTLPADKVSDFIDDEKQIFALNRELYFPNNTIATPGSSNSSSSSSNSSNRDRVTYKVKSGDNVGYIATWFKTSSSNVRSWNSIRRNMIRVGQKLTIYVPKGEGNFYSSLNSMSFSEKQATTKSGYKRPKSTVTSSSSNASTTTSGGYVIYTVKRGDTVWGISKKFSGVSSNDILKANNLSSRSKISIGQKLKIKKA